MGQNIFDGQIFLASVEHKWSAHRVCDAVIEQLNQSPLSPAVITDLLFGEYFCNLNIFGNKFPTISITRKLGLSLICQKM